MLICLVLQQYRTDLNSMWDKIELKPKQSRKKGQTWAREYLESLIVELIELKIKAKNENNLVLYNQLQNSLIRAHEVQKELNEKLKST
ncbi:Hypothetical protein Nlim_0479 [Candidatus Nitrosarchaeum limnium SFB1]|jgi:hypothetical protein|uniref:Transposase n=1 Tax=Candidatus Nitrosarchaeum limnium SFB1 TaxID=886738 RepID=F3KJ24_9ARCH|nr:Hypothetical protein Nlim_0479 [Candidatus Nitrosarchaeum limnium SFB1]